MPEHQNHCYFKITQWAVQAKFAPVGRDSITNFPLLDISSNLLLG